MGKSFLSLVSRMWISFQADPVKNSSVFFIFIKNCYRVQIRFRMQFHETNFLNAHKNVSTDVQILLTVLVQGQSCNAAY
jgi:hypothetical protein